MGLALLPLPRQPLQARFCDPYIVTKKVKNANYINHTSDKQRTEHLCHVNMLKQYSERVVAKMVTITTICAVKREQDPALVDINVSTSCKLQNSEVLANLKRKLDHLMEHQ